MLIRLLLSLPLALFALTATAFPDKPVRVVTGFSPGGGSDILLRTIQQKFAEKLGTQVLVDYRVGANGNIAAEFVAKAPADGYTLLMGFPGLATNPSLYTKLPYDSLRDFAPVGLIGSVQNVLLAYPGTQISSVRDLVERAKAQPGKLTVASPGVGSSQHLAAELFEQAVGIDLVHVPYKGGGEMLTNVVGGHVQVAFIPVPAALTLVRSGQLKALAVTGPARADTLPDVPTMQESGLAGYTAFTWNGLLAPAGTPKDVVTKLNDALVSALKAPEMKSQFATIGQDALWSTPEEFSAFLKEETEKWRKVIQAIGLKVE